MLTSSNPFQVFNSRQSDSNRRNDTDVRSAIESIQDLLFDPEAPSKIFPFLLEHISTITESDYSVILTGDKKGIVPICSEKLLDNADNLHCVYAKQSSPFISKVTVLQWINSAIMPMRPVFFNDITSSNYSTLLLKPEQVSAIMLLPVISQNHLQGICVLAKKQGGYNSELMRRLMPLLGSVVCVLQSAVSVKGNLYSLNQEISDNRFLNTLLATSPIATMVVSKNNHVVFSNHAAQTMFVSGNESMDVSSIDFLSNSDGIPISIYDFLPEFDNLFKWSNQQYRYGSDNPTIAPRVWENQIAYQLDGHQFLVNISVFRYTHGISRYTVLQIQDVTAIKEKAEEYQQASQQLKALTHLVPVGIIRVDVNWNCVYANDKWYELSGLTNEESQGTHWINALHSDDAKNTLEKLRGSLEMGCEFQTELQLVSPLGQVRWVDFNTQVLFDEHGRVEGFLGTFADITERLLHQERLRHVAEYDGLTGLANRNLFQDRLQQAFYTSGRSGSDVIVLFLDLDGFKDINDSLGHPIGDSLLQQVADRLLNALRKNDTVARFGGDEFVILLSTVERKVDVSHIAKKIVETIAEPFKVNEHDIYITVSIGIAMGNTTDSSPEKILKHADAALYTAKNEGKNNYQLFNEQLDNESKHRIALLNELRLALKNNSFFLVYQPQATLCNQQIVGFEALLRFRNNNNAVVLPESFIPLLEETGMIIDVGQWILEEACKQLCAWKQQGVFPDDGFLSINVSPKQLLDESIVPAILNACNKYQINPQQLVIELTETVIIDKPQKVQKAMELLKSIGVNLALDDFGTGYSSLTYLQRYPFDHIKIDKSFVANLLTDQNDAKITKAIIALAKSLGLKITAEGVADKESLDKLKKYGADYYQGYFLSKPVDVHNANDLVFSAGVKAADDIASVD